MTDTRGALGRADAIGGLSAGIFLLVLESDRLAALQYVEMPSVIPAITMLVPLVILGVLTACLCVRPARRPLPLPLLAAVAAICSLSVALRYLAPGATLPWAVQGLARALFTISAAVLLFGWLQRVVGFGRTFVVHSFGMGAIVVGCLGAFTIVLERGAAVTLVVALPLLGVLALRALGGAPTDVTSAGARSADRTDARWNALEAIARGYRRDSASGAGASTCASGAHDAAMRSPLRPFIKLVPFLCYAVLFGNIHFSWVYLQSDGHFGVWVQLGASVGAVIAGLVAMGLARLRWGRALDSIMGLLLTVFALVALWLSTFLTSGFVFAYLVVLNVAQKLTFLMMLLLGFAFADDDAERVSLCSLAYFSFFVGTSVSFLMGSLQATSALNVGAVVALAIVLVADTGDVVLLYGVGGANVVGRAGEIVCDAGTHDDGSLRFTGARDAVRGAERDAENASDRSDDGNGGRRDGRPVDKVCKAVAPAAMPAGTSDPDRQQPTRAASFSVVNGTGGGEANGIAGTSNGFDGLSYTCHLVAERHGLTRREEEILQLLVRGRSTARIAETLCITPATTRTHLRNIYAKLDVHSQQEVLDLYERERGSLRG